MAGATAYIFLTNSEGFKFNYSIIVVFRSAIITVVININVTVAMYPWRYTKYKFHCVNV